MRQRGTPTGCVRPARLPAPLRAVGEGEAQLTVTRSSHSISPFAPPAFTGFNATTKRSDFCMGLGWSSLPPSGLPLGTPAARATGDPHGPMQISQGKDTDCTAAPVPNTAPISVGFWASRSLARSPDRPGLPRASLAFGAAARLRLPPHTSSRRVQLPSACGCYQLAPQRTSTSYPGSMPGTPRVLAALASPSATKALDPARFPHLPRCHTV